MSAAAQQRRVVVVRLGRVDHVVEDEPRPPGRAGRRPAELDRHAELAVGQPRRRGRCCASTTSTSSAIRVGDERLDVVGQVVALGLAGLGRDVADVDAERGRGGDGGPDLRHEDGRAGRSCRGCPGRARPGRPRRSPRSASRAGAHVARARARPARCRAPRMIRDWPATSVPSRRRAWSVSGVPEAGTTVPRTARTRFISRTASSKSPSSIAFIAAMRRLPTAWPARLPSSSPKRYWSSSPIAGSVSASATRQLRMSPTAGMPSCSRRRPVEPPSSATVTTAVRFARVLLEAAEERRQAGAAADRDDPRAAGEEPLR